MGRDENNDASKSKHEILILILARFQTLPRPRRQRILPWHRSQHRTCLCSQRYQDGCVRRSERKSFFCFGLEQKRSAHDILFRHHFCFFMTCTVSPFDMLRTRLMNQPSDKKLYTGMIDAAMKITKNEGPLAFYRGFFPIWARFAPTATLQLLIFEQLLERSGYKAL